MAKKVGDKVEEGEILAEIETDKATMEFESFHEGTLLHIEIQEGVTASVDSLLCIIGDEGEDISQFLVPENESLKTSSDNNQLDLVDQINEQENTDDVDQVKPLILDETDNVTNENTSIDYITMPRLSDTMEEGTISSWLKDVGEKVVEGEILAEIETDKATMEFESFYDGILSHIAVQAGETVKVDELIAIISDGEIDVNKALENYSKEPIKPSTEIKLEAENIEQNNDSVEVDMFQKYQFQTREFLRHHWQKR